MISIIIAALILIASVTFLAILKTQSKKTERESQSLGLNWLKCLRNLLANVQKHRGLSTGYLKGELSLLPEVERLQNAIAQDISVIEAQGKWMNNNERWQNIDSHWQRLSSRYQNALPTDNLNQHNVMIQNILYLIEDMSDEHALIRLKMHNGTSIEFLWKDLLQTIEYMGQARAIGTGVAATGLCGSVDRIKLNYLHKKIEQGSEKIVEHLGENCSVRTEVANLLEQIKTHILTDRCTISPNAYFSLATKTLESAYDQFDRIVRELSQSTRPQH